MAFRTILLCRVIYVTNVRWSRAKESLHRSVNSACKLLDFLQVIINLESRGLHFVKVRLSGLPVFANSRSQAIVKVVFQGVDPVGLVLLEGLSVSVDHFHKVLA